MTRRLSGAALNAAVVRNLREWLAADYGLPMGEYDVRDVWQHSIGSDMQPIMSVIFRRRSNDMEVTVDNIHPADNGEIDQSSRPELG